MVGQVGLHLSAEDMSALEHRLLAYIDHGGDRVVHKHATDDVDSIENKVSLCCVSFDILKSVVATIHGQIVSAGSSWKATCVRFRPGILAFGRRRRLN